MKQLIFIFFGILMYINCNSQVLEKEIKIDSRTLRSGGEYILISAVAGKSIVLKDAYLRYNPNNTVYTINNSDSVLITTTTPNSELDYLFIISDSSFTRTVPYRSYSSVIGDFSYSNNIKIIIPTGKFTVGTGDLYIKFKYELY